MAESLTEQLKLTEQLREQIEKIQESASKVTEAYSEQAKTIEKIVKAMNALKPKDVAEGFKEVNESAQEAAQTMESSGDAGSGSLKKLGINVEALEKKFGKVAKRSIYATAAFAGLHQGFKNILALSKGFVGFAASAAEGIFKIGTAIISIPFKMFKGLIDTAQEAGGDMTDLLQEIENVRKQFGQFAQSSAKAVFDVQKTMGGFAETGLSTWRVFGTLAERMAYIRELATGMGVAWSHMVTHMDMKKEGGHILAYQKGLGLAAEEMKGLYDKANATGKPITELGVEMTKYSYAMADQFGLSAKEVSRDVGKAIKDVRHFGQLTIKEINIAATYARKLNVEFEKITGTLDAFETFDSAADNAAKLAQSFGLNVDSFKMMEAQNPAEQLDMLRKSMFAAGKDADKMNRQELKLLATTTGLDEATAKQAFSYKNQGVSLDEVKKKANSVENAQMTQAKAMSTLAGAIERMVKSGALEKVSGFFDAFVKGMLAGVRASQPFIKLMWNIRLALRATWFEGFQLGRGLIKMIPGLNDFFENLQKIFDPDKFKQSAKNVRLIIEDFFRDVVEGKYSFRELMEKMRAHFFNFFNNQSPEGMKFIQSLKKGLLTIGKIFAEAIKYAGEEITKGINALVRILKDPKSITEQIKQGGGAGASLALQIFGPIIDSIKTIWPDLRNALSDLFGQMWEYLKKFFESSEFKSAMNYIGPAIAGVLLGPVVTKLLMAAVFELMGKALFKGIEKAFEKQALTKITQFAGTRLGQAVGAASGIAAIIAVGLAVSSGMKDFRGKITGEFTDAQKDIAAGATGIVNSLMLGLMPDWLLTGIVNWAAKLVAGLQESLDQAFSGLGSNVMGYLGGWMKFMGGIGDVLFGIFEGDTDRVMDGIWNIVKGAFTMMFRAIQLQVVTWPAMLLKLLVRVVTTVWSTILGMVAKIFDAVGLEGIGKIFHTMSDVWRNVGRIIGSIIEFISGGIGKIVGVFTDLFSSSSKTENGFFKFAKTVGKLLLYLIPVYTVFKGLSWVLTKLWVAVEPAFDGFVKFLKEFWEYGIKPTMGQIADGFEAFSDVLAYAADFLENFSKTFSYTSAKAHATLKEQERKTAKIALKDAAKEINAIGKKVAEDETKKNGSPLDPLLDFGKGIDVDKAPTAAINAASDAISKVTDVKSKLKELSPESIKELTGKVAQIFTKEGDFMKFVKTVNENMSGPDVAKAAELIAHSAQIFDNLGKLSMTKIGDLNVVVDSLARVFSAEAMKPKLESLNNVITWASIYGATMDVLSVTLRDSGIKPALEAVSSMVSAANDLDKALSDGNLGGANVKMKLANVAKAVGLGGKANYEIRNRGVVIQVNMVVEMKAEDVEEALVLRGKSIIRDRLEHAQYTNETKAYAKIPDKPIDGDAYDAVKVAGKIGSS